MNNECLNKCPGRKPKCSCDGRSQVFFKKIVIPAELGDDNILPPKQGAYKDALVFYEANSHSYIYDSNGMYTLISNGEGGTYEFNELEGRPKYASQEMTSETNIPDVVASISAHNQSNTAHPFIQNKLTIAEGDIIGLSADIDDINEVIPAQATQSNQLADKAFVNSSINSVTAFYVTKNAAGDPFATKAELTNATVFYSGGEVHTPTRNDYCVVLADESKTDPVTSENPTTRYIYQGTQWEFQYIVNKTSFTAVQLAALNSGITDTKVAKLDGLANITTIGNNLTLTNGRLDATGGSSIEVVQSTGQSTTAVMSQKAVTDSLAQAGSVTDVQVNGTSVLSGGVANIPAASTNTLGVTKASDSLGTGISSNTITTVKATDAEIVAKSQQYKPIVPNNLNKAVMEGLGNNSLTWTDGYKQSARTTIGAAASSDVLAKTTFTCEMVGGTTKTLTVNGTLV